MKGSPGRGYRVWRQFCTRRPTGIRVSFTLKALGCTYQLSVQRRGSWADPDRSTTTQRARRLVLVRCFVDTGSKRSGMYVQTLCSARGIYPPLIEYPQPATETVRRDWLWVSVDPSEHSKYVDILQLSSPFDQGGRKASGCGRLDARG